MTWSDGPPQDLDDFMAACMSACMSEPADQVETIFMTEEVQGIACLGLSADEAPDADSVNGVITSTQRYAALATKVSWAPNAESETGPCWLVVGVERGDGPGRFSVGQILDAGIHWWRIEADDVPWFAFATSGSLRARLNDGRPLGPFKKAVDGDPALFGLPGRGDPPPPVDEDGFV